MDTSSRGGGGFSGLGIRAGSGEKRKKASSEMQPVITRHVSSAFA
jgi:hypothetical protein